MNKGKAQRILIISYDFPVALGGIATCALKMTKALEARTDTEVLVIAPKQKNSATFDNEQTFSVTRVPFCEHPKVAALLFVPAIYWKILTWKPDSVVAMSWFPDGLSALIATALSFRKIPYFVFAHGVEVLESKNTLWKKLRRRLSFLKKTVFQKSRMVFAVSQFTKDLVHCNCSVAQEKIKVVNNGVNCLEFFPMEKPQDLVERYSIGEKFVFLTVCRLDDYKGADQVIKAVRLLKDKFPSILYLVVGNGPDRSRLQLMTKEYSLENFVKFTGAVKQQELVKLYNLADCFIMPCREDKNSPHVEGFGIVFLEASACEKPVIAGASGGVADAVEHDHNGWLVNPRDPKSIAECMERLITNPKLLKEMGTRGRTRAQNHFRWDQAASKVYESIVTNVRN